MKNKMKMYEMNTIHVWSFTRVLAMSSLCAKMYICA